MKKRRLVGFAMIFAFCILPIGGYYWGTNLASDKITEKLTQTLEDSEHLEEWKESIEKDPEVQKFLEQAMPVPGMGSSREASAEAPETADPENTVQPSREGAERKEELPFTTKEEAARVLIKKVGLTRIQEIHTEVEEGSANREQIMAEIQSKLSEEEIQALKVIAYKELSGKQEKEE
ncbi:hypothetical protein [Bacillus sp. FJAT-27251]|uniref:hypothetical protein n=1 Tax=Bacillus sp. FJAT-27251 TaxID=1684142 RepID=UPI0006A7BA2A|nr:hypothetical protein [Bacillus sp. FJAT-27251]